MNCNCCPYKKYAYAYSGRAIPYLVVNEANIENLTPRTTEIHVRFVEGVYERRFQHLYQWDKGLYLCIHGIEPDIVTKVQYANTKTGETLATVTPIIVEPDTATGDGDDAEEGTQEERYVKAEIPDELLETAGTLTAYIMTTAEGSSVTLCVVYLTVIARPKENDNEEETDEGSCCTEVKTMLADMTATIQEELDSMDEQIESLKLLIQDLISNLNAG